MSSLFRSTVAPHRERNAGVPAGWIGSVSLPTGGGTPPGQPPRRRSVHGLRVFCMGLFIFAACERETRPIRVLAPATNPADAKRVSGLQPGPAATGGRVTNPYEANAYGIAQGQRLFTWMNCAGCHAHGGGAIGPPLLDGEWIYGGQPENIFASIVEGRPNGMPSYGGRLTNDQVWQLVAYVQSLSGHVRKDAAPGRVDHMHVKQRELAKETEPIRGEKGSSP